MICSRRPEYLEDMSDDTWASSSLANLFVDEAYATVKGYVRTYVMHQHLLEHLPSPPATVLDPSSAMLDKARERLELLPSEAQRRVRLVQANGEEAEEVLGGQRFDGVLCHGVLGYLEEPEPVVEQLCRCAVVGGIVSIMTGNAHATAVQPAMERRWQDALAAFDQRTDRKSVV